MKKSLQLLLLLVGFMTALSSAAAIPDGYSVTPANNATVTSISKVTVSLRNCYYLDPYVNRSIKVNGEQIAVSQKATNSGGTIEMTLATPVDQSGTYTIEVPARMFTIDMWGEEDNPAMSWTVIVDNPDKPIKPDIPDVVVVADPAAESTVAELTQVKLTFQGADAVAVAAQQTLSPSVSYNGLPAQASLTFSAPEGNSITLSAAEPFTESGSYTVTIPAGVLTLSAGSESFEAPEVKLNYTLKAPLKVGDFFTVDKIRYQILSLEPATAALTFPDFKAGGSEDDYAHLTTIDTSVAYEGVDYAVTEIGDLALSEVKGLTDFAVPEGITRIGEGAFWDSSVETVVIPASVTEIGESAFEGCQSLTAFTLPATVAKIGSDMFYGCVALRSISLPEGMTEIPESFLQGCGALTEVTIPSTVTKIGKMAMSECALLADVTLPDALTAIDGFAFAYTPELRDLPLPETVTTLGNGVFYNSGLLQAALPEAITVIPDGTFQCCADLISFTTSNNVTEIEKDAFYWCFALQSFTFGEKVATIGENAFLKDDALTEVVCLNPTPAAGAVFSQTVYDNARLTVPAAALEAYKAADGWKEFKNIVPDKEDGISAVEADELYSLQGNSITLLSGGTVVDTTGRILHQGSGSATLAPGIYIVSTPKGSMKIKL